MEDGDGDGIDLNKLKSEEEFDSQWISLSLPPLFSPSLSASSFESLCSIAPPSNNFHAIAPPSNNFHASNHNFSVIGPSNPINPSPSFHSHSLPFSRDFPRSFEQEKQSSSSTIPHMSNPNLDVVNPLTFNANVVNPSNPSSTPSLVRSYSSRPRRNPTQTPHPGKSETIPPPYPWATNRRATFYCLDYLIANGPSLIEGDVQCRRCDHNARISFHLPSKFQEIRTFILSNLHDMRDRAPPEWMNPVFPACQECRQPNCMKPVISDKKKRINWLFMFLGQTLGCCNLEQLKYFCKHTQNHRTGAKNRVLYLCYMSICKQLDPNFFNI